MRRLLCAIAVLAIAPVSATADVPISPVAYSMLNGQSGFNGYHDDTYNGAGNPNVDLSSLSGGVGQLTDGIVGTNDIFDSSSFQWVGWRDYNPVVIVFDFGSIQHLTSVSAHAASVSSIFGDVDIPGNITIDFSNNGTTFSDPVTYTPTPAEHADPSSRFIPVTFNHISRFYRFTATDGDQPWQFYSEFQFTALPEPGMFAVFSAGLLIGCARRRSRSTCRW